MKMRLPLKSLQNLRLRPRVPSRSSSHVRFHPTLNLEPLPTYLDRSLRRQSPFMDLTFLGSSAQCSTSTRGVTSALLRTRQCSYLIDAGDGVCRQLLLADFATVVDAICITHLHGDHLWGLATVVRMLAGIRRDVALVVCGPPGVYSFLVTAFRISGMKSIPNGRPVEVYEFVDKGGPSQKDLNARPLLYVSPTDGDRHVAGVSQEFLEADDDGHWTLPLPTSGGKPDTSDANVGHSEVKMRAGRVKHIRDTFGFVAMEQTRRRIDAEKCTSLGLPPSTKYKRLLMGEDVTTDAGHVIRPDDVCWEIHGRKIAYIGDSYDPRGMSELIRRADILVHEATFLDEDMTRREAVKKGHSTSGMAGQFGRELEVGALFLNHFGGQNFRNGARNGITGIHSHAKGTDWRSSTLPVVPAEDFMHVKLCDDKTIDVHGSQWLANLLRRREPCIDVLERRSPSRVARQWTESRTRRTSADNTTERATEAHVAKK